MGIIILCWGVVILLCACGVRLSIFGEFENSKNYVHTLKRVTLFIACPRCQIPTIVNDQKLLVLLLCYFMCCLVDFVVCCYHAVLVVVDDVVAAVVVFAVGWLLLLAGLTMAVAPVRGPASQGAPV